MATVRSILSEVLSNWPLVSQQKFKENPFAKQFRTDLTKQLASALGPRSRYLKVSANIGLNRWQSAPGFIIYSSDVSLGIKSGFYLSYLFCADGSGVYLSLNQADDRQTDFRKQTLLRHIPLLSQCFNGALKLHSEQKTALSLQKNNIAARFYCALALPDEQELLHDLNVMLDCYFQAINLFNLRIRPRDCFEDRRLLTLPSRHLVLIGNDARDSARFVREQAKLSGLDNLFRVDVGANWHEPLSLFCQSDEQGALVPTDVLKFVVDAWLAIVADVVFYRDGRIGWRSKAPESIGVFWLCLDEIEGEVSLSTLHALFKRLNRSHWQAVESYQQPFVPEPIIAVDFLSGLSVEHANLWRKALGLEHENNKLWYYFVQNGIGLPFNLLVAAIAPRSAEFITMNKLIDQALVVDFNQFYPVESDNALTFTCVNNLFEYPVISAVDQSVMDRLFADPKGVDTLAFFKALVDVLGDTPFTPGNAVREDLLLMVCCFDPKDKLALQAVWDDFLILKILPKISGTLAELQSISSKANGQTILDELVEGLSAQLSLIWQSARIDWFREQRDATKPTLIDCRSRVKLQTMNERLAGTGSTRFWP